MSFFGSLSKKAVEKVYDLASKVEGGRDYLTSATNTVNTLVKGRDPRVHLKHGNIIQLFSRSSGRTIQIVMSKTNQLICNAIGGTGSYYSNACWMVIPTQNDRYYFHNNYNYLAIKYGQIVIIPLSMHQYPPPEAEFRVQDVLGSAHAVYLESVRTPGCFIGFNWDGEPCNEIKIETREKFAQLEIHLIADGSGGIQPELINTRVETFDTSAPPSYWEATNGKIMKRSIVINNSNDNKKINEYHKQQRKRSLEDSNLMMKLKKRRHLSPQYDNNITSSSMKIKTKQRSSLNNLTVRTKNTSQTSRKSSSRRYLFSTEHLNKINLPNWECISPNINQILSDKHTKSGVYAHEIHLIQQELEALLSMSMIRENILHSINFDNLNLKIHQHQQAEYIYSSKYIPKKFLPPLINHQQHQHNGPHILLDRQVSMTSITDAHIDKIWSDINTYYRQISLNDISIIKNFLEFNQQLKEKIFKYKNYYKNNKLTQLNIIEQLNKENFQDLLNLTQINPIITHYINRTALERFQTKLYEQVQHTSSMNKNQFSTKSLNYDFNSNLSLRCSPRLQPNYRTDLFSLPNFKSDDDDDHRQSLILKRKKQTRFTSMNSSLSIKFQEHIQLVHDYLTDQHSFTNQYLKQQFINDIKLNKKRKTSIIKQQSKDIFESKLSTLISLLHECSSLSLYALKRANLQYNNEQTWKKLNKIEYDLDLLIQDIDKSNNSKNTKKTFQTLDHLLKDWKKYEYDFDNQFEQLFDINI
ncbi:unnamed protein product [Rotaria sordida]|uniref:Uncharacterized protein n=1 Tax=Rotaria sordida TaxID=392033 RepID=A0A815H3H9_9BILA|nr:unnamed protein product [Rotaria sordida]